MARQNGILNPDHFREQLRSNQLRAPVFITGMVKPIEGNDTAFLFTAFECENWVTIPYSSIASTQVAGSRQCKDHQHPVATLELNRPDSGDAWSFDLLAATFELVSRWEVQARAQSGGDRREFEDLATPSCASCQKRCLRLHPHDFFAYSACAHACPGCPS